MSTRGVPVALAQGANDPGPSGIETPAFITMEQYAFKPIAEIIEEAERNEEARQLRLYGPDDAPPRPVWPVEWCERCNDWSPTNAFHSHPGDPPPPRPAPPRYDPGKIEWV